jgi:hypothetical protein
LDENSAWLPIFDRMGAADRAQWVKLFDPSQYLPGCKIPMLWLNGTNDFAYPLDSYQKSWLLVKGPRTLCVTVRMKHSHPDGWAPKEIGLFADSMLKDGKPLPQFKGEPRLDGDTVSVEVGGDVPIERADLHFTTDAGAWNQRVWNSQPALLVDGSVVAKLPQTESIVYFLTITDQRGAVVSTGYRVRN